MNAPPVLTAERIDAMLSIMAEVCLESVVQAGERQKAAEGDGAFERCCRALQGACRNLRQTIAMKQRFDREEASKAAEARKAAEATRVEAERERRDAVGRHYSRVRRHFERVLWDEYEETEAQERFEALDDRLTDLAEDSDFLDLPAETLIQRLADQIGVNDLPDDPAPGQPPPDDPPGAEVAPEPAAIEAAAIEPAAEPPPPEPEPPLEPPGNPAKALPASPPPEPWPQPYVPPWERLKPGQIIYGGSGW